MNLSQLHKFLPTYMPYLPLPTSLPTHLSTCSVPTYALVWVHASTETQPSAIIQAYMHTCTHTYIHTYVHAYIHTCIHAHIQTAGPSHHETKLILLVMLTGVRFVFGVGDYDVLFLSQIWTFLPSETLVESSKNLLRRSVSDRFVRMLNLPLMPKSLFAF